MYHFSCSRGITIFICCLVCYMLLARKLDSPSMQEHTCLFICVPELQQSFWYAGLRFKREKNLYIFPLGEWNDSVDLYLFNKA